MKPGDTDRPQSNDAAEYQCDWCEWTVPDGAGFYVGTNRVCEECYVESLMPNNSNLYKGKER